MTPEITGVTSLLSILMLKCIKHVNFKRSFVRSHNTFFFFSQNVLLMVGVINLFCRFFLRAYLFKQV